MGPKLKLTGGRRGPTQTKDTGEHPRDAEFERVLTFPAAALAQLRLVAGKVNRRPFEVGDAASNPGRAEERPTGHTLARIDALTTGEVIHRVEETLRQMQHGIDRLKHDQGQRTDAFKFPGRAGTDRDDLPPAA